MLYLLTMEEYTKDYNSLKTKIETAIKHATSTLEHATTQYIAIKLFSFFLNRDNIRDSDIALLNVFSYFVTSQKAHLYNWGYFTEKIEDFAQTYKESRERFKSIINNVVYLSKENDELLIGKKIRYDDLYSFEIIKNGIGKVEIDMKSLHNLFKSGWVSIQIINKDNALEFSSNYDMKDLIYEKDKEAILLKDYKTTHLYLKGQNE